MPGLWRVGVHFKRLVHSVAKLKKIDSHVHAEEAFTKSKFYW